MKTCTNTRNRLAALLLALTMLFALTACGSTASNTPVRIEDVNIGDNVGDIIEVPAPEDFFSDLLGGNKDTSSDEKTLARYGEIETLTKSVKKPTEPNTKNVATTSYGTLDWSTAAQGYVTFTGKSQTRMFRLQGPDGTITDVNVAKDETVKLALMDGAGTYQYMIANANSKGTYTVVYKNSFKASELDTDLERYLTSTPYGDYENAPTAVAKAEELWDNSKSQMDNIKAIAKYVGDLKYDKTLANGSINVYVNPDDVIKNNGGVCNDMAKLLVAMLRSQGVPAYYQGGTNRTGGGHSWVMAWVELSTSTKSGVTSSKGAWVLIEATSGAFQTTSLAERNYTPNEWAG